MIRTYMQQNSDWFANSDPFSRLDDMESEIAELRTLTKVTRLRKQIECREEGAWMVVKDVPDDRAPSGMRKVTSYGITKRSVTRSVSSNVGFNNAFGDERPPEPLVQLPGDDSDEGGQPSTVEITEVFEEPLRREIPESKNKLSPDKAANKKTSVVMLGKGNLVLIDPEEDESNFHVTGISKGKVADVVSTLEKSSDKRVKKVGFCKTEVHFAPDSGKINIVETDEKPPPTQVYRKKKRSRGVKSRSNSSLPKHYFGDMDDFGEDSNLSNESDKEDSKIHDPPDARVLSDVRDKLPTFERTIKSEGKDSKYRHSSPEKNNFDIEKIESEEKDVFKKLKQPSFREKFLKETSYVPEKLLSNCHSDLENFDKHPRLRDNLYIYGGGNSSKDKELLKSYCKLSNDHASTSNTNANLYTNKEEAHKNDSRGSLKADELGQNLRFVELLKFSSSLGDKDNEIKPLNNDKKVPEVRNIPIVQTGLISDENHKRPKSDSISDKVLDLSHVSRIPIDQDVRSNISFLGNVSPKLQNLIQNSVEHEFQLRQKQILKKKNFEDKKQSPLYSEDKKRTSITLNSAPNNENEEVIVIGKSEPKLKPVKIVTQVHLGPESETKHEFQLKREEITKNLFNEPIHDAKNFEPKEKPSLKKEEPIPAPRRDKESQIKKDVSKVPPKPKPRTITSVPVERCRTPKTPTRVTPRTDSSLRSKRVSSKDSISRVKESDRSYSRSTVSKEDGKCKKMQVLTVKPPETGTNRAPRVVKVSTEVKGKKVSREPLRSFEKVSNGWVGHIVPVKQDAVTVTTKVYSSKTGTLGHHTTGSRKSTLTSSTTKSGQSHSTRVDVRRETKQFSLSKEHLTSAKLVKEITPRRGSTARKVGGKQERGGTVDSYRTRPRRESERSDDSVIQADEEVRAYMFDGHKNKQRK